MFSKKYVDLILQIMYFCFLLNMCTCLLASTTQIDAAKDVIKKLSFSFDSESFENPCESVAFILLTHIYY